MLRWGRWTAVRVLGSFASGVSGSKNVREIKARRFSFILRQNPSSAAGLDRVSSTDVTTNEVTTIAAQPTPSTLDVTAQLNARIMRDMLAGKRKFDAFTLRCSYGASRPLLLYLTKSEFSTLIALFGALSHHHGYPLSSSPGFSLSPDQRELLAHASRQDFGSWWDLVVQLGEDQAVLGRRTSDADSYWLMLANLSCCLSYFSLSDASNCTTSTHRFDSNEALKKYLVQSHIHYIKLAKNHLDQAVHYDYLRRLLRIYELILARPTHARSPEPDPQNSLTIGMVQANMTNVLKSLMSKSHFRFEPRLASLVWRIIGTVQFELSQRKSLLHTLRSRFMSPSTSSRTRVPTPSFDPLLSLRKAILGRPTPDDSWSYQEAHSILHDSQAWGWLQLLANSSQEQPCSLPGANSRLAVLLTLHQLEKSQTNSSAVLERWWDAWMAILGAEARSHEHRDVSSVDRATLLAFLRLAALCRSSRVVLGSERLLAVYSTVMLQQDGVGAAETPSGFKHSLSVSLGAAYACLGTSNLAELVARLRAARFDVDYRLPHTYLSRVIELLLELRAPRAAWNIASQVYAEIPPTLVGAIAYACARSGLIAEAISFLPDNRLGSTKRRRIAHICLCQLSRQQAVLTRKAALHVCEALGPKLDRTPLGLRHVAVRMALNAGLVHLAGIMGTQWWLSPQTQRLLAARIVKARFPLLAPRVVDKNQMSWLRKALKRAGYRKISLTGAKPADNRVTCGENNATRRGNIYIARSSTSRRRRLGGRAQLRATLAALARLLRNGVPHGALSWSRGERASFEPDAVTLNIVLRALGRSPSCVSSNDLRALFDLLARSNRCGRYAHGNHFGTEADYVLKGFASSAVGLVGLVPSVEGQLSFVRHLRPLLKTFLSGFRIRGDQEGVRVVMSILRAEDAHWKRTSRPTRAGA